MNKVLISFLLSSIVVSCAATKDLNNQDITQDINKVDSNQNMNSKDNKIDSEIKNNEQNVQIVAIPEMDDIPQFNLSFENTLKDNSFQISSDKYSQDIMPYMEKIKQVNIAELSKWSKPQTINYKLLDERFKDFKIESIYSNKSDYLVKVKLDRLPSNTPIVIRDLYLYNLYNSNKELKTIYVTIQGHVEE